MTTFQASETEINQIQTQSKSTPLQPMHKNSKKMNKTCKTDTQSSQNVKHIIRYKKNLEKP